MKFEIKNRLTSNIIFTWEGESLKLAVQAAVESKIVLRGADLSDAVLRDADLSDADLRGADLSDADLSDADLSDADLRGAVLSGAVLRGAVLSGADLRGAVLSGAVLSGADLRGAVLTPIRDDLWAVLSSSPSEVLGLRQAIIDGKIDGSTYSGDCSCLVGTIATLKKVSAEEMPILRPNSNRPIERFFLGIKVGDTPETNPVSKLVLEWTDLWLSNVKTAFSPTQA
jgi:hypothetical protein